MHKLQHARENKDDPTFNQVINVSTLEQTVQWHQCMS